MQNLLASVPVEERGGFWRRQFSVNLTSNQIVFDVIFGILMPLFCFYFDPGILRGSILILRGPSRFSGLSLFVYAFSGIAIIALIIWLALGNKAKASVRAGLGGALLAGATVSFTIGVIILPLTLFGLFILIGFLGFVPFFTGFVYLRNGVRAIGIGDTEVNRTPRVATAVFGALIALGIPGVVHWKITAVIDQSLAEIVDLNSASIDTPLARIKRFHFFIDSDRIIRQYERETNSVRQERLDRVYKEITGEDIETRLRFLND